VRRALAFLLRNWPLKLGAVLLASVLYGGIVLSQDDKRWLGRVVIEPTGLPARAALLGISSTEVISITYRADLDVASQLTNGSFRATVDLSRITPQEGGPEVDAPVTLETLDRRVQVIAFEPSTVKVRLDPVVVEEMPVTVVRGEVPKGVQVGTPQVQPARVTVEGASSRVASIQTVEARVNIDASGLHVDEEVDLVPLDAEENEVQAIELTPPRARVRIAVGPILLSRTVPVLPTLQGQPPEGYEVRSVVVEPLTVTVSGSQPVVDLLQAARTRPLDVTGLVEPFEAEVDLDLPAQLTPLAQTSVTVRVEIEPQRGSRTFQVGVVPRGARADRIYSLSVPQVTVTLAGPMPYLWTLDPATLVASAAVGRLDVGSHDVEVEVVDDGPARLLAVNPRSIEVVVSEAPATPTPSAAAAAPAPTTTP